jgi:tRNA threonylcarbamoyladenosine biosynthesis protein TsaE
MLVLRTTSADATRAVGAVLAKLLGGGEVVLLSGELGSGKTTLVKGVVAGLKGSSAQVRSPTFTLVHRYATEPPLLHVDVWRLERLHELDDLGLEEELDDGACALIEWGDRVAAYLERATFEVRIARLGVDGEERQLELRHYGEPMAGAGSALAAAVAALDGVLVVEQR